MNNPTSTLPISESLVALQTEVQRKVGRNLLRLQGCELLMKALAVEREFVTSADVPQGTSARNGKSVSKMSMGQVVGDLTENYLRIAPTSSKPDEDYDPPPNVTLPLVRTTTHIEVSEADFERTEQKLAALVDLRNELVHHFLEKFDLSSEGGCQAANAYLDEGLKQVEANYDKLRQWANQAATTKALHANLINTPEFTDLLIHGILPNGAGVEWSYSTIVNLLRDVETVLAEDGWTSLTRAIDHIRRTEPEHSPKRYGCSSWRHLLHECKQFEVRKHQSAAGLPTEVWYRSRP